VLCSDIKADDFIEVKKALQPLFKALFKHFNVNLDEVKTLIQYPSLLEQNFLERSKSTQAD
jgi:hypothetical protein